MQANNTLIKKVEMVCFFFKSLYLFLLALYSSLVAYAANVDVHQNSGIHLTAVVLVFVLVLGSIHFQTQSDLIVKILFCFGSSHGA